MNGTRILSSDKKCHPAVSVISVLFPQDGLLSKSLYRWMMEYFLTWWSMQVLPSLLDGQFKEMFWCFSKRKQEFSRFKILSLPAVCSRIWETFPEEAQKKQDFSMLRSLRLVYIIATTCSSV